jgi:hypothetical protein
VIPDESQAATRPNRLTQVKPSRKPVATSKNKPAAKWHRQMVNGYRICETERGFGLFYGAERIHEGSWFHTKEEAIKHAEMKR